ncbi:hypothetical protein, partial [Heyndrickxia coagulans]|uniref:hypothetical protein n=1 Tax=Heyndrickxia coagulans TaxID=1398 RepID=UPI00214D3BF8
HDIPMQGEINPKHIAKWRHKYTMNYHKWQVHHIQMNSKEFTQGIQVTQDHLPTNFMRENLGNVRMSNICAKAWLDFKRALKFTRRDTKV